MKKIKISIMLMLVASLTVFWIIGCTGDGVFDVAPESPTTFSPPPTQSPIITPTATPTGSPVPGEEDLKELATGRSNAFNIKELGDYVYWVEKSSTPQGTVFRIRKDGSGSVETIISGLNNPSGIVLATAGSDQYLFVGEGVGGAGGSIWRVKLSESGFPQERLTSGIQGEIPYMDNSGATLYFTRDSGGGNSAVMRVEMFPDNLPAVSDEVNFNLSNAYDVKVVEAGFSGNIPVTYLLVTSRVAAPNGRVFLYNMTNNPVLPVQPLDVSDAAQFPSRVTYQPVSTAVGAAPDGYVYWTNFAPSSGQVVRQRVKFEGGNVQLSGPKEIVAQSMKAPYAIMAPADVTSGSAVGTLNKLFVSANVAEAEGGNWKVIDISNSSAFPLTPASSQITDLISNTVAFPLNGILNYAGTQTLYFTSYNKVQGGSQGIIYRWTRSQ